MPKRRKPSSEPLQPAAIRRLPAVGDELVRLIVAATVAMQAAGQRGLTKLELAAAIDSGRSGAETVIKTMRAETRIYVVTWRHVCPAYALGDSPDVPRPTPAYLASVRLKERDVLHLARQEVVKAHAQWAANWVPHRDPAAAWIGSAA